MLRFLIVIGTFVNACLVIAVVVTLICLGAYFTLSYGGGITSRCAVRCNHLHGECAVATFTPFMSEKREFWTCSCTTSDGNAVYISLPQPRNCTKEGCSK